MTNTQPVKIMIIEDHPAILESLHAFLNTVPQWKLVGVAKNIKDARLAMKNNESAVVNEVCRVNEIDLVIMDIRLPDGKGNMIHDGGIELTAELSDRYPDLTILVYSGETNVEFVRRALSAGASGYLVKGTEVPVIKQAIDVVLAGGTYLDPALPEKPKQRLKGETLTPKEEEVMRLFSRWMTRKEIAHALNITRVGVNAHCINISSKLDFRSHIEFYREAIRRYGNPDVV